MAATSYRPDIDGLRAIAILSVVFYHVGLGCPGGYVGVDIFFVISGFLITSLILKDLREDKFSLAGFWERRLRRIFPALAATVFVTLIAGWFLLLPEHLEKLGKSTVAQSLLSANIYFWRTDNYFGGANEDKPLLHTWSLAVEEQFYLFFPLILIFLFSRPHFRQTRFFITALLAGLVASLLIAIWGVKHQPYATFYLLPTRAWELLCGALVASLPAPMLLPNRPVRETVSWIGLLGIVFPLFLYNDNTPFPGLAALPPCLGAALLIWANTVPSNTAAQSQARTLPASILSLSAVAFIGLISYSLYLWHWPVIAISSYWKTAPFSTTVRWGLVAVSLVLAVLSWKFVESPFRNRTLCGTRRKIFTLAIVSSLILCLSGFGLAYFHGVPARLPKAARSILDASLAMQAQQQLNVPSANPTDIGELTNNSLPHFGADAPGAPVQFLVWGDSHAEVSIPAFETLGKRYNVSGCAAVWYSTPPLVGEDYQIKNESKDAAAIGGAVVDFVKRNKIPYTFVIGYWSLYEKAVGDEKLEASLTHTINALEAAGTKVYVIMDVPSHDTDATRVLMRNYIFHLKNWDASVCTEADHRTKNSAIYNLAQVAGSATFLDPAPSMLDAANKRYWMTMNGIPLYFDRNHLSEYGVKTVMLPLLEKVFAADFHAPSLANNARTQL